MKAKTSVYKQLVYSYFKKASHGPVSGNRWDCEAGDKNIILYEDVAFKGIPYYSHYTSDNYHVPRMLSDIQCKKILRTIYGSDDEETLAPLILQLELQED